MTSRICVHVMLGKYLSICPDIPNKAQFTITAITPITSIASWNKIQVIQMISDPAPLNEVQFTITAITPLLP